MVYRIRSKYTAAQKSEIRDRWQRGESLNSTLMNPLAGVLCDPV